MIDTFRGARMGHELPEYRPDPKIEAERVKLEIASKEQFTYRILIGGLIVLAAIIVVSITVANVPELLSGGRPLYVTMDERIDLEMRRANKAAEVAARSGQAPLSWFVDQRQAYENIIKLK